MTLLLQDPAGSVPWKFYFLGLSSGHKHFQTIAYILLHTTSATTRTPSERVWQEIHVMSEQPQPSQPTPLRLFNALNGYQVTLAVKSGVELEVFTHIADGANTTKEIAHRANASERGIRILCDFLTVQGFLTK